MTARQIANVDALKAASAEFTAMGHLAMQFRGLLRGGAPERLKTDEALSKETLPSGLG